MKRKQIILYWVSFHACGTEDDQTSLAEHQERAREAGARIRNADAYHEADALENCDAVMGPDVPERYKSKPAPGEIPAAEAGDSGEGLPDIDGMTVDELKKELTARDIPFHGNAGKQTLVDTLKAATAAE